MWKITNLLTLTAFAFVYHARADLVASVSALYTFTVDPTTVTTRIVNKLALALNRDVNSATNAENFGIDAIEGMANVPCSSLTSLPSQPVDGITTGCHRIRFNVSDSTGLSEYEVKYLTEFWSLRFASQASDSAFGFDVVIPPYSPEGPSQTWLGPPGLTNTSFSTWLQRTFPQDLWVKQSPSCVSGVACENLTIAPSVRYQHSAVVYKTWNFKRDVLPHPTLCYLNQNNSGCTESCLTDFTCFGATSWDHYFSTNAGSYLWGNMKQFFSDDGLNAPAAEPHESTCPPSCCGTRRLCMRTHDDLGRHVPFDRSYMLVFGGRTREKKTVNGMDVYLNCMQVIAQAGAGDQTYASCLEYQSEELWRYDIEGNVWELLKPRTAVADQGYPVGRYGHSSALVTIDAANDIQATRRQYMFIFGGYSTDCSGGICSDLWRYEIPWAAQAFWPPTSQTLSGWNRGNVWRKMKTSPVGGLFRHSMVSTQSGTALLVYGGQQMGNYSDKLLIYTLSSDSWEIKTPTGYRYFTRSSVDYLGNPLSQIIENFSVFKDDEPEVDVIGPRAVQSSGGQLPLQRADHCTLMLSSSQGQQLLIVDGFRTYGSPYPQVGGGPYPTYPYYLENDVWGYNLSDNFWQQQFVNSGISGPSARRGASCLLLPRASGDDLLLLFGGSHADELFNDFWSLEIQSGRRNERIWRRIDSEWNGTLPDPVTYHSAVLDDTTGQVLVFGGLRWHEANLTATDLLVDNDRRCGMNAVNVLATTCLNSEISAGGFSSGDTCALAKARTDITTRCQTSATAFCCTVDVNAYHTLQTLSRACQSECEANAFQTTFSASFGEGIWVMNPNGCANDCSGNGDCELSVCNCKPGFSGSDCSVKQCPGSFCYFDSIVLDQHCVACSSNGACQANGECACEDGWTGPDCSMAVCPGGCSGAGTCLDTEFPLNQCVCDTVHSGYDCSEKLCLNACSFRGNCTDGLCSCDTNFHGDDCSVYVFTAGASGTYVTALSGVIILLAMIL